MKHKRTKKDHVSPSLDRSFFQIIKWISKIFIDLINYMSFCKKGVVEFTNGDHQIFIKTCCEKVWIHIDDNCFDPTCSYLENDTFSIKMTEGGFIIIAHIESNSRKIYWFSK